MKKLIVTAILASAMAIPALASEASFDRTLSVKAQSTLLISTGSGWIHLSHGSDNQIHIVGHVHTNGWGGSDEKVKEIAANPPIQQTGDIITVGKHEGNLHNISIDYEVQAPQNVLLNANTGSGDIKIEGVGENAKLETGSGQIHAHGVDGTLNVETGSGDIDVELHGTGDVKAETGSGSIQINGVHGSFNGETGSGDIHATGTPEHNWKLETGSGTVDLTLGSAPFTLDAETGSGGIHVDQPLTTQGTIEKDHVRGTVNGGGPLVKVETGSGGVHVH
jgi:DUF4097 and DUF4098 domain-containing protein YvlB